LQNVEDIVLCTRFHLPKKTVVVIIVISLVYSLYRVTQKRLFFVRPVTRLEEGDNSQNLSPNWKH